MRSSLSRAAVVGGATLSLALGLAPGAAHAETSASCPAATSTRLVTGDVLGNPDTFTKLWVYDAGNETVICFELPKVLGWTLGKGAVVITGDVSIAPPTVTPGADPAACTIELVDFTDPARVRIAAGASGSLVCFTVNNSTTSVALDLGAVDSVPDVELWRDGIYEDWLGYAYCEPLALYYETLGNEYWADYYRYECRYYGGQLL